MYQTNALPLGYILSLWIENLKTFMTAQVGLIRRKGSWAGWTIKLMRGGKRMRGRKVISAFVY